MKHFNLIFLLFLINGTVISAQSSIKDIYNIDFFKKIENKKIATKYSKLKLLKLKSVLAFTYKNHKEFLSYGSIENGTAISGELSNKKKVNWFGKEIIKYDWASESNFSKHYCKSKVVFIFSKSDTNKFKAKITEYGNFGKSVIFMEGSRRDRSAGILKSDQQNREAFF